ncbi:hypothetical protein NU09_0835 [Flavobacterium beibuense]|uniref:Uncharacterized protein n=1 Tax=Flavobacterium beibuense TaxID=657326 RepID=A0A444WEI6_9FLAO|nr:hypothetical protein NU09_0835 [Flavobacterium beibuense]
MILTISKLGQTGPRAAVVLQHKKVLFCYFLQAGKRPLSIG